MLQTEAVKEEWNTYFVFYTLVP